MLTFSSGSGAPCAAVPPAPVRRKEPHRRPMNAASRQSSWAMTARSIAAGIEGRTGLSTAAGGGAAAPAIAPASYARLRRASAAGLQAERRALIAVRSGWGWRASQPTGARHRRPSGQAAGAAAHLHMHVTCMCTHVRKHVCKLVRKHVRMRVRMRVRMHVRMHVRTHVCVCVVHGYGQQERGRARESSHIASVGPPRWTALPSSHPSQ